tara:strand:+ start:529 stop:1041 length:513 start_codon:yes stop_codon:yes gene_type:complete
MDLQTYADTISFRRVDKKFHSDDCPICYMPIEPTQNIIFNCAHNACTDCVVTYLKKTTDRRELPTCFLCRSPLSVFDTRNRDFKRRVMTMLQSQNLAHEIRRTNRRLLDDIFADQMLPIGTEQAHNEPHFFVIHIRGIPQSFYLAFGMGRIVFVLFFMLYMWKCFISLNE